MDIGLVNYFSASKLSWIERASFIHRLFVRWTQRAVGAVSSPTLGNGRFNKYFIEKEVDIRAKGLTSEADN